MYQSKCLYVPWLMTKEIFESYHFAARKGKVAESGAYFATSGSSTYFDEDDPEILRYDLSNCQIADTNIPEIAINICKEALNLPNLSESSRDELNKLIADEAPFIDYILNDKLPLPWAAKRFGYDGIKIWENDDVGVPTSVFIFNVDKVIKVGHNHYWEVKNAVERGEKLPENILKDYPDLREEFTRLHKENFGKKYISLKEKGFVYCHDLHISGPQDAAAIFEDLQNSDREKFVTIALDENDNILGTEVVSIGTLNSAPIHPRECLKTPINLNAKKLILIHNHPSGTPEPSKDDIRSTSLLMEAAKLVNIEIPYHIIIGTNEYVTIHSDMSIYKAAYSDIDLKLYPVVEYESRLKRDHPKQTKLTSPEAVVEYIKPFFTEDITKSFALFLDTQNNLITMQLLGFTENDINLGKISRLAISSNASSFVLCSNFMVSDKLIETVYSECTNKLQIEMLDYIKVNVSDKVHPFESFKILKRANFSEPLNTFYVPERKSIVDYEVSLNESTHTSISEKKETLKEECFNTDSYRPYEAEIIKDFPIRIHNETLLKKVELIEWKHKDYLTRMKDISDYLNSCNMLSGTQKKDIATFLNSEKAERILTTDSLDPHECVATARLCCDKYVSEEKICEGLSDISICIAKEAVEEKMIFADCDLACE